MNSVAMVHVVDDDRAIRKSLEMLLESASLPVRVYESAGAFLDEAKVDQPGCLVLDLRMPDMGGMELLQKLSSSGMIMPVIIMSGHADVPTAVRGMKLGAIDVLQKPFDPKVLLETIRRSLDSSVESHRKWVEVQRIRERVAELTPRELDLLKLLVAGRSNKQVANDLGISIKTVANHRANLMAKMGALNAADLTRLSLMAGVRPQETP